MKLYRKIRKRTAKKQICGRWKKLNFGRYLKPGNLISTCIGYNQIIENIQPTWIGYGKFAERIIIDFDITTVDGSSHSLVNCCEDHLQSKGEIQSYWLSQDNLEYKTWYNSWGDNWEGSMSAKIVDGLKAGEVVFLSDGRLNPGWREFAN